LTVAETFALPIGQRVPWTPDTHWPAEEGEVAANGDDGLLIVWPDGEEMTVAPDDDDVHEFAGKLENAADQPVIVN
jgi:hypothetical protein